MLFVNSEEFCTLRVEPNIINIEHNDNISKSKEINSVYFFYIYNRLFRFSDSLQFNVGLILHPDLRTDHSSELAHPSVKAETVDV